MNRRDFVGLSGAGAFGTLLTQGSSGAKIVPPRGLSDTAERTQLRKRPNIVLFMPDEMRADALACYGNPVTKTPNFDRLRKRGTQFSNCHVQYPVCGASRCSMLTGWPTSVRGHRSLFYFLRPEEPNLFRYLKQSGYEIFWFGKNDALAARSFYDSVTHWSGGATLAEATGPKTGSTTPGISSMLHTIGGDRRDTGDYQLITSALEIIERKEADRPFCIFLPMGTPHPPYTAPADFYNMYSPVSIQPLIPADLPRKPSYHAAIRRAAGLDRLNDADFRKIRAVYYGQISYSDWMMGQVLEALEKNGRDKDTAIMLLSDHGDYAGDYGLVEKWPSALEDCLTHVPLIIKAPGGVEGHRVDDLVELYDVMATCLGLAGVKAQHTHFARDLSNQLIGAEGDPHRAAFAEGGYNVYEPQCFEPVAIAKNEYTAKVTLQNEQPQTASRSAMIRTKTHKLISRPQGQNELYDLSDDPREKLNLFGDAKDAEIQLGLQVRLLEHFINTSGIAPFDKDSRLSPPNYPTRVDIPADGWEKEILDSR